MRSPSGWVAFKQGRLWNTYRCQPDRHVGRPWFATLREAEAYARVMRNAEPSQMRRSATVAIGPANRTPIYNGPIVGIDAPHFIYVGPKKTLDAS